MKTIGELEHEVDLLQKELTEVHRERNEIRRERDALRKLLLDARALLEPKP